MAGDNYSPDDLTVENLTPHVIQIGSDIESERLKLVFAKLIQYSHDFVRDTRLTTAEWEAAWRYLTEVGEYHLNGPSLGTSLISLRSDNFALRIDKR